MQVPRSSFPTEKAMTADFTNQQPATYTELPLDGIGSEPSFGVAMCKTPCWTCVHHEPFGEAIMVVWCSKHRGHVPAGATCAFWMLAPPADQ
jgi:hypothetical protein